VCPPTVRFISWRIDEGTVCMIVIGADTHKSSHTIAAVDAATGRLLAARTIAADEAGQRAALKWARRLDGERVWAIEDCRHVAGRLERALVGAGERAVRVAPKLMGESRRGERQPGKSDEIDALAVARAALREGVEALPSAYLDEHAMEIRLLAEHRSGLIADRTRAQNRLRWHLLELCPRLEASIPAGALDRDCWLDRIARALSKLAPTARVRVAREELRRIRALTRSANALERELAVLVRAHRPALLAERGCGALTAATFIARTAGASRFRAAHEPRNRSAALSQPPHRRVPPPQGVPEARHRLAQGARKCPARLDVRADTDLIRRALRPPRRAPRRIGLPRLVHGLVHPTEATDPARRDPASNTTRKERIDEAVDNHADGARYPRATVWK
jgi:transposase